MPLLSGGNDIAGYEVLSHTADTGIATHGTSLDEVIGNAAFAMFDLMYDLREAKAGSATQFEVEHAEPPDLLVGVLSELLYRGETDDVAFSDVEVQVGDDRVSVTASGHPTQEVEAKGPPIKAVTYHDLRCESTDEGWHVRVIFDV